MLRLASQGWFVSGYFRVGAWLVKPSLNTISNNGTNVQVEPKVMEVLVCLATSPGDSISKETIIKTVWPDTFVSDDAVFRCVSELRRVFGDDARAPSVIQTIPKRGYRLVASVEFATDHTVFPASPPVEISKGGEGSGPGKAYSRKRPLRRIVGLVLACAVVLVGVGYVSWRHFPSAKLTEKDTIVLSDFDNNTGDPVFDDALKTALNISLRQSPFLNVLSDNKITTTLKLMTRPPNTKITPDVAREICQRTGGTAYVAGSIARLGSEYVVGLKVVNCQSGEPLAQEQTTAATKEKVLNTLGEAASKLRGELGESIASVEKLDVPLEQATTTSLDALQAYSLGQKAVREMGPAAGLPHFQRAVELDPTFASGYFAVGLQYDNLSETGRAVEYLTKAFQLREHTSDREKMMIISAYYSNVTGELDKTAQTLQEWVERYPRDGHALGDLGIVYDEGGRYDKAAEAYEQNLRLTPDNVIPYANLANVLTALQRPGEAQAIVKQAQDRKLHHFIFRNVLYALAFIRRDTSAMAEQQQLFAGSPEENYGLSLASDTEAFAGHLGKARELTKRSADSAIRADSKETGAIWLENSALREAAFGDFTDAERVAEEALKLVPASQGVEAEAALAYAMAGGTTRAETLAKDLNKRFPLDTQIQSLWLPAIQAQVSLNRKDPAAAISHLHVASPPIEYAQIAFVANISCLYPTHIRGQAYLAAGRASEAAAEFQKILDHSGIVWNCWTGALAKLGIARANALQSTTSHGVDADAARVRALAGYKDFLILWKDADPNIPILKQANAEYAKLQ